MKPEQVNQIRQRIDIRKTERMKLVSQLIDIRKDWVLADYRDAYPMLFASAICILPNTNNHKHIIEILRESMSEYIYHTYDLDLIEQCIADETDHNPNQ